MHAEIHDSLASVRPLLRGPVSCSSVPPRASNRAIASHARNFTSERHLRLNERIIRRRAAARPLPANCRGSVKPLSPVRTVEDIFDSAGEHRGREARERGDAHDLECRTKCRAIRASCSGRKFERKQFPESEKKIWARSCNIPQLNVL